MRVVVDLTVARGQKTGIGHYASELFRFLCRQANGDRVQAFPPRWLGSSCTLAKAAWTLTRPRSWGRAAADRPGPETSFNRGVFRKILTFCLRALGSRNDLYHETNFIPLPTDLPTVTTLHDLSVVLHPEWHPAERVSYFEREFAAGLARSQHFLAISEFGRAEVIRTLNLPPERVTRTYMGIRASLGPLPAAEVERSLQQLGLPPRYLLYLGTIEPRKNVLRLLQVYCTLPPKLRSRWPLLLVGGWGWNTSAVADFFHNEARHRGVHYHGYIADRHLAALYNGARALVYPSLYEGFGLPPVEMMACGGAVLASTAGALVETVGRRAHLIDPEDTDGWRAALIRVLQDDDWCQELRRGAVDVARPFTWEQCAADTWRVYRHLVGRAKDQPEPLRRAA
jgi:alpha-1,3-rhamnosyl/mannosyltransferase